ncbi:hypothetical protein BKK81_10060 [Cupriavidus sp. USMAHM13]|uniref:Proline-rich protein n=1 Tax=Cupriavidus malaysiensis TaxID=367825 RepID=A0ABN4TNG1_9BURK|nr:MULTISPECIES: hypothetical protein [Cupriavidus]AOY99568.1 hypothetical protein BKK81_10060 [Cupriavidus sp. USMAHM13]AOZ06216.1 hypothetical protein BKK80_10505 [Cupriavidus malaysiensis]
MDDPVYLKTAAGHDEIRTRERRLEHRLRALLLLVNGQRPRSELLAQLGSLGIDAGALAALLEAGLIAPAAPDPAPDPAPDIPPANPPVPGVAAARPAAHAGSEPAAADGYRRLYRFYTETIGQQLGLRGYLLQVKVEKAANLQELAALREPFHVALEKARGAPAALALMAELDRLLAVGVAPPSGG